MAVILTPAGRVIAILDAEGLPVAVLGTDASAQPGRVGITVTGQPVTRGWPVNVELPAGMTHAVFTANGRNVTLEGGPGHIYPPDLGYAVDEETIKADVRALATNVHYTNKRNRVLRRPAVVVVPPPPAAMTLSGVPTVDTTGVVASAIGLTALPTPSVTPSGTPQLKLRLYSAETGGTLISETNFTDGMANPNETTRFACLAYGATDPVYGNVVWVESARWDINTSTVGSDPIQASDITWYTNWALTNSWGGDPLLRQVFTAEFEIKDVPTSAQVQWRINAQRYQTAWTDCPIVTGNRRKFGDILCPEFQPHTGRKLNEFLPQLQDRNAVEFRWRASTSGSWLATDPGFFRDAAWMRVPVPSGANNGQQFNALPLASGGAGAIANALPAGWTSTGLYIVGLASGATYTFASTTGQIASSNRQRTTGTLVITSVDRANPATISGTTGRHFEFETCNNWILDRVQVFGTLTESVGHTRHGVNAVGYAAPRNVNAGMGVLAQGCQRFYVQNCFFDKLGVSMEWRDCGWGYNGFNRRQGEFQDGWRWFWRGNDYLIEGELGGSPELYPALIAASDTGPTPRYSPIYHPDVSQVETRDSRASITNRPASMSVGGLRNFRRVHGRYIGPVGVTTRFLPCMACNDALRTDNTANRPSTPTDVNAKWNNHMHHNWTYRGMCITTPNNSGLSIEIATNVRVEDTIVRKNPTGPNSSQTNGLHVTIWIKDLVIVNSVAPNGEYLAPTNANQSRQSQTDKRAQTTGGFTVSATAKPIGWTRGDSGFPCGPDAWAA